MREEVVYTVCCNLASLKSAEAYVDFVTIRNKYVCRLSAVILLRYSSSFSSLRWQTIVYVAKIIVSAKCD